MRVAEVLPGLYRFEDSCAVYLLVDDETNDALVIDYGSGDWRAEAQQRGLPAPTTVLLTHHHAEQCAGLERLDPATRGFTVHAAGGERAYLEPERVAAFWQGRDSNGVPASYSVLRMGVPEVSYDLGGFADYWWGRRRLRCLHTPGHGQAALSFLLNWEGEQVLFSGDAVHAGGTIWQPYMLEWDHWTGGGALAAWEGLQRIFGVSIDLLCPSHGRCVVGSECRASIGRAAERLLDLVRAKGQIAVGMPDCYFTPTRRVGPGIWELHPRLYQFGTNGYLLLSGDGAEGLVIDPQEQDMPALSELLAGVFGGRPPRLTAATATHYHYDHCDALDTLRRSHGTQVMLHPRVAAILHDPAGTDCPWRPPAPIMADLLTPEEGELQWADLTLSFAAFPGQTWWHAIIGVTVDGQKWVFAGDNFQPPSRWNGTGGFCSYNGSRFEGFRQSAKWLLQQAPDRLFNGHGTYQSFHAPTYAAIIDWSSRAAAAVTALCPNASLREDYYLHEH